MLRWLITPEKLAEREKKAELAKAKEAENKAKDKEKRDRMLGLELGSLRDVRNLPCPRLCKRGHESRPRPLETGDISSDSFQEEVSTG